MGARMRGVAGMVVAAATMLAAAPSASAGTYDVVSCGAPSAGGVNAAWRAEYGGYVDPVDGDPNIPPAPGSYEIANQCPTQLLVRSSNANGTAPFLTSGNWVFDAPAGTRLTRLETWRFGARLRTNSGDPDTGQGGDQGDPWRVWARDDGAQLIGGVFGENCIAAPGAIGCSFGSDTGVGAASRAVYGINVGRIAYSVSCEVTFAAARTSTRAHRSRRSRSSAPGSRSPTPPPRLSKSAARSSPRAGGSRPIG